MECVYLSAGGGNLTGRIHRVSERFDASQEMHRKLLERLKFETRLGRNTDLNLAQDF